MVRRSIEKAVLAIVFLQADLGESLAGNGEVIDAQTGNAVVGTRTLSL